MHRSNDVWKTVGLASGATALLTVGVCAAVYSTDVRDAEAWRNRQAYEAGCVKHFAPGWSFDPCEVKAVRDYRVAVREAERCSAFMEDHKNFTPDELDAACGGQGRP